MSLYRLDPPELSDPLWRRLHDNNNASLGAMGTAGAVTVAKHRAKRLGQEVTVSKIDGNTLRVSVARIVSPSGKVRMPA